MGTTNIDKYQARVESLWTRAHARDQKLGYEDPISWSWKRQALALQESIAKAKKILKGDDTLSQYIEDAATLDGVKP